MQDAAGNAIWLKYTFVSKMHPLFPLHFMKRNPMFVKHSEAKRKRTSLSFFFLIFPRKGLGK